jgi:hypothetical protein
MAKENKKRSRDYPSREYPSKDRGDSNRDFRDRDYPSKDSKDIKDIKDIKDSKDSNVVEEQPNKRAKARFTLYPLLVTSDMPRLIVLIS